MTPTTTQAAFSAMRGHVADGTRVRLDDGRMVRVVSSMDGWRIVDDSTGAELADCGGSAAVVECLIVRM